MLNESTGTSPVFLGPRMLHFTKDEETFSQFASEIRIGNSGLDDFKCLGVDMKSAIYNGLKCHNQELYRLVCVRHLKKRDEENMLKMLQKTNQSSAQISHSKPEVLNDIYGERTGTYNEYGLTESYDMDDFNAKLISLKEKWEALIPRFYGWFDINQKTLFIETVVQSAREKADIPGFYYQNNLESQLTVKKCIQNYKKEDILVVIKNLKRLSDRQDTEEVRALHDAGSYTINEPYKKFLVQGNELHSWRDSRRREHVKKFLQYVLCMTDRSSKPRNSGRKPSYQKRHRSFMETEARTVLES